MIDEVSCFLEQFGTDAQGRFEIMSCNARIIGIFDKLEPFSTSEISSIYQLRRYMVRVQLSEWNAINIAYL
jgi:hypothetical protein